LHYFTESNRMDQTSLNDHNGAQKMHYWVPSGAAVVHNNTLLG
jgi:hypothetical protein